MLLRNKKTQGEEQNWCLILNPLKNEIDRKKVVIKISQVFTLSPEEAADLVSNTPIILLDNLTRVIALKLKEFFLPTGAEMELTNDTLQKRKCYRTVWPEPPNLSFLLDWSSLGDSGISGGLHGPEENLEEIPSMGFHGKTGGFAGPVFPQESLPVSERERLLEEIERWRKECLSFQEESRRLKEEIEKGVGKAVLSQSYSIESEANQQLRDKEKELKELRLLYSNAQEKNEMLKEEFRESRTLYEEKIAFLIRESEQWKKKTQELNTALQAFQESIHKDRQEAVEMASRKELEFNRLREDHENANRLLRENLSRTLSEIEQVRLQGRQSMDKIRNLENLKQVLEAKLKEQSDHSVRLSEEVKDLEKREQEWAARAAQEKTLREKTEAIGADLEKNRQNLAIELEAASREVLRQEARVHDLEKRAAELGTALEDRQKNLAAQAQLLESRERELDSLRRQVRDMHQHIEQREAVQRRAQLVSQLAEKEICLKKMVQDQEKIEREIRDREEAMRKILTDQEALEKEIIEARQAQRHFAEQAKREKTGKFKAGTRDPSELETASTQDSDD